MVTDKNIEFMQEAIKESALNLKSGDGGPFGAVIVKDGKIIARGHNEVLKNNDPTCHGEMQVIRAACKELGTYDLTGCELYTSAQPCPMCLGAIIWSNIKTVYYGNRAKDAEAIGFRDAPIYRYIEDKCQDKTFLDMTELGRDEAIKVFEAYHKEQKTIY